MYYLCRPLRNVKVETSWRVLKSFPKLPAVSNKWGVDITKDSSTYLTVNTQMIWLSPKSKINVTSEWKTLSNFKAHFQPYSQLWVLFSRYSVPHWIPFQRGVSKLKYFGLLKTSAVWRKKILFFILAFIELWKQILGIHLELEESLVQFRERAALNWNLCSNILLSFNQSEIQ